MKLRESETRERERENEGREEKEKRETNFFFSDLCLLLSIVLNNRSGLNKKIFEINFLVSNIIKAKDHKTEIFNFNFAPW